MFDLLLSSRKFASACKDMVVEEGAVSKGFRFVQFDSEELAMVACAALHDTLVHGRKSSYMIPIIANFLIRSCDAVIMKDVKGKSKGFGFVKFKSPEEARKAVEVLNGAQLVSFASSVSVLQSTKYSTSNISNKDLNYGNYWGLKATTSHKKESIKSGSLGTAVEVLAVVAGAVEVLEVVAGAVEDLAVVAGTVEVLAVLAGNGCCRHLLSCFNFLLFALVNGNQVVFVNDALHWLTGNSSRILALDLDCDVWRKISLPDEVCYGSDVWMKTWVLKDYYSEEWHAVDRVLVYHWKSKLWKEMYSVKNSSTLPLWFSAHAFHIFSE
ncbi:hypothetical protein EZV62_026430 [Acer yangbiense]|uniref:RRM domain-containing protein n=1 Tax=Acer yangbiense TaxID=1000413 RepID=A0A5C7GSI2_9ROSI|nr:hypothetical protein EZV62_026430 [Acer yangbiense]